MTINNRDAYFASLWDWGILDGCFGETKIRPTDLDGLVERNGQFLVIETKLPGVKIGEGQLLTFEAMVKDPRFWIMFIWGRPGMPEEIEVWHGASRKKYVPADLDKLRLVVGGWFDHVNSMPDPDSEEGCTFSRS